MQIQNAALKKQVEALNHVQAKLVAKTKRLRGDNKEELEGQLGVFNPGELPDGEGMTRNDNLEGKESAVSLPEEAKIKAELEKIAESDEEDDAFVKKIEEA